MRKPPAIKKWQAFGAAGALGLLAAFADPASTNQVGGLSSPARPDPDKYTIDDLVKIRVTSVSKKETSLFTSAAAVYVITHEDIQRSGMTTLPELLRMVPGLDVAQIDANHWAISSRGFNSQYANKLLVLIDGRSIYTPVSAGVDWNVQDVPLGDIDRIEVIRGPGAALWGANAVNGVINIITKSAKDTQGGEVTTIYGTENQPYVTARYGGQIVTNLYYRGYVTYFNNPGFSDTSGKSTADGWDLKRGGFRMDWEPTTENTVTLQGDVYHSDAGETIDETTLTPPYYANRVNFYDDDQGEDILGRWTHSFSDTSQLTIQSYYDHSDQGEAPVYIHTDTYDFDLQHRFALCSWQDIVWGAGYRYLTENVDGSDFFASLNPNVDSDQVVSGFVQDDITVLPNRLHVILGTKVEHNDLTGFEVEPSGRIAWTPTDSQTVWGAISRADRTPAELERDVTENRYFYPVPPAGLLEEVFGNPNLQSEKLTAYELGYRIKPTDKLSFDLATFYNVYDDLITPVSGIPYYNPLLGTEIYPLTFNNAQHAKTYGAEISGEWQVINDWKITASYTFLEEHLSPTNTFSNDPQNQFQIHSYVDLPEHVQLNGGIYYVDAISPLLGQTATILPSYVRVDVGVTWKPVKSLEVGIFGQNLAQGHHDEFTSYKTTVVTEVPRSIMGRITWRF